MSESLIERLASDRETDFLEDLDLIQKTDKMGKGG